VALELEKVYNPGTSPPFELIAQAIQRGFGAVDDHLMWGRYKELLCHKPPSSSITEDPLFTGSCDLLSIYNSQSRVFYVALAGDSRAVLCRRNEQNARTATPLSTDQSGLILSEEARLRSEHPGEEDVRMDNRLLCSLQPTRALAIYFRSGQMRCRPEPGGFIE
jgi:pyruvate dehydrogenase phosphatase